MVTEVKKNISLVGIYHVQLVFSCNFSQIGGYSISHTKVLKRRENILCKFFFFIYFKNNILIICKWINVCIHSLFVNYENAH